MIQTVLTEVMSMKEETIREAAEALLQSKNRPMHYLEITSSITDQVTLGGRTPQNTVRKVLGTSPTFKRVDKGTYALSVWAEYPEARFAKDIAYDVLSSQQHPMLPEELGKAILKERQFRGSASSVAINAIQNDSRFSFNPKKRLISLVEWDSS